MSKIKSLIQDEARGSARLRRMFGAAAVLIAVVTARAESIAYVQAAPVSPIASVSLPEPIFWKQTLFQIPYQWGPAAEPGTAHVVWLLVSKDRGATWHKISEAKPHVKSFNYRAEAEGEFWFAVRTLDHQGRQWPAGEYQPELCVIVDTTMPRIEALNANTQSDGSIAIHWRAADLNLDPSSWKIEAQVDASGNWQIVYPASGTELGLASPNSSGVIGAAGVVSTGQTVWQPSAGQRPVAIRATVLDRAGNSATFQTEVQASPHAPSVFQRLPPTDATNITARNVPSSNLFDAPSPRDALFVAPRAPTAPASGWVSSSTATAAHPSNSEPLDQMWPAVTSARAPFRLSNSGPAATSDAVTAYGNPNGVDSLIAENSDSNVHGEGTLPNDRYALHGRSRDVLGFGTLADDRTGQEFQPLPPFRQASAPQVPTAGSEARISPEESRTEMPPIGNNGPTFYSEAGQTAPEPQPKLVGSRTFALEYDLQHLGRWGVSNVELWGTRDGGQTWRCYASDDDQRSPLVVTVDEEGLYGFRIVVESTGATAVPPNSGEEPELWVAVDLRRPVAELTAIEPGPDNLPDQLTLRWRAVDDNLEVRPISLFYSSRPTGPWSAIATNLENTGQHAWRVERHVPTRFYVRLEARDTAGNLAAFQTREPIEFSAPAPTGRLRSAEPADPTATGADASYR